jgi:hypothetical protein
MAAWPHDLLWQQLFRKRQGSPEMGAIVVSSLYKTWLIRGGSWLTWILFYFTYKNDIRARIAEL